MVTEVLVRFYALVKWDYNTAESKPYESYEEAEDYGKDCIVDGGAWSFTVEKRYVKSGKENG